MINSTSFPLMRLDNYTFTDVSFLDIAKPANFGYVRLSRDEDTTKDSLENQKKILMDYAKQHGIELAYIFEDDNVSGYTFDRDGLNALRDLIDAGKVNTILVKDLSRLGRNNAKTLIFLDYLKEQGVRLIAVTENIDTRNMEDDMILGIKTWYNELYVKDISKKIRTAVRQRMKEGGLVIVPQFGYKENPEKPKTYIIDEPAAATVRKIFELYLEGYGDRKIADYLNEYIDKYPTPATYKKEKYNRGRPPKDKFAHVWSSTSVSRILRNDVYIGTLRCGKTQRTMIKGGQRNVPEEFHIVHENFFPPIIDKETFELAQKIRQSRVDCNVRAKTEKVHRYAGILECGTCGKPFVFQKRVYKKTGKIYKSYRCSTYHRHGIEYCTPHTVAEEALDEAVMLYLKNLLVSAKDNLKKVDEFIEEWNSRRRNYDRTIETIRYQIAQLKEEIKSYSRQLAKGQITDELFEELTKETMTNINMLNEQLNQVQELQAINADAKKGMIKSVEVLEKIVQNNELSNAHLNLLINKIIVKETDERTSKGNTVVDLVIKLNAPFKYHEQVGEVINKPTLPCGDVGSLITLLMLFNTNKRIST